MNQSNQNVANNVILSNMMTIVSEMNEKLSKINCGYDDLKQCLTNKITTDEGSVESQYSIITHNISSLHAKLDQHFTSQKSTDAKNSSTIIKKLNDLSGSSNLPSTNLKMFNDNRKIGITPSNKNKVPLDWSFFCNRSSIINDNVALFHMLSGFELITWTSFDYLRHKINDTML